MSDGKRCLMMCLAVSTQYQRVTNKQTNEHLTTAHASHASF